MKYETVTVIKCKGCGEQLPEVKGLEDQCPECGATGGQTGSWWFYA